jgi:hypothetical protein
VRLAGAGRAEQDDVLFAVQEVELAEMLDQRLLDRVLEGEVELLERLSGGEPRGLDATLAAMRLPGWERRSELAPLRRLELAPPRPIVG